MSVRKRCSAKPTLAKGTPNPLHCPRSPRCGHHWLYDFRVNGRRYRASTETADKHQAQNIEARERARILEGRHGIRRQPDITFREFAKTYLRDHAELHKRSVDRDREIIKVLNRSFGSLILHEITAHRIEQFKRTRLAGKWRGHKTTSVPKPIKPATVNRELDTLKSILSKAVEWGKLLDSPARKVKRLRVDNTRTRILTPDEQRRLLSVCSGKLEAVVTLALISGARIGELLTLRWDQCGSDYITFLRTKNDRVRRLPVTPAVALVLNSMPGMTEWVFPNRRTGRPYTGQGLRSTLNRALLRAGLDPSDVSFHTLRHTALSRMIDQGADDYTVMAVSGHSSTRMLARYTHPTEARKVAALESFTDIVGTIWAHEPDSDATAIVGGTENRRFIEEKSGGRHGARTHDLRVANAALSQLS